MRGQIVSWRFFADFNSINRVCLVDVEFTPRTSRICVLPQRTIQEAIMKGGAITVAQEVEFMKIAGVYIVTKVFLGDPKE